MLKSPIRQHILRCFRNTFNTVFVDSIQIWLPSESLYITSTISLLFRMNSCLSIFYVYGFSVISSSSFQSLCFNNELAFSKCISIPHQSDSSWVHLWNDSHLNYINHSYYHAARFQKHQWSINPNLGLLDIIQKIIGWFWNSLYRYGTLNINFNCNRYILALNWLRNKGPCDN